MMAEENNYSESPYVASRAALLAAQKQHDQTGAITSNKQQQQQQQGGFNNQQLNSVHSSFQKQQEGFQQFTNNDQLERTESRNNFCNANRLSVFNSANNNSTKSNAIFDRFDIINSEKPHRFKVKLEYDYFYLDSISKNKMSRL
jgi:hypothetical protein